MFNTIIPLVDWGMGTALIAIFAIVCVVIFIVVYNMVRSGKNK